MDNILRFHRRRRSNIPDNGGSRRQLAIGFFTRYKHPMLKISLNLSKLIGRSDLTNYTLDWHGFFFNLTREISRAKHREFDISEWYGIDLIEVSFGSRFASLIIVGV